jgi:hypothetical protein
MACFEGHHLAGVKLRNRQPGGPSYISLKGSCQGLFIFDADSIKIGTVFVAKDEICFDFYILSLDHWYKDGVRLHHLGPDIQVA